jgi:hypothetical protein
MSAMYATYLAGWKTATGGTLFNHYCYVSDWNGSGSWGEKKYEYDPATPKSSAIATFMAANLVP